MRQVPRARDRNTDRIAILQTIFHSTTGTRTQLSSHTTAHIVSFATLGIATTLQEMVPRIAGVSTRSSLEVLTEETLCLLAVLTARVVEASGLSEDSIAASSAALLEIPYTWRDYLLGGSLLERDSDALRSQGEQIGQRLDHGLSFYTAHLPVGLRPDENRISDILLLWVGRITVRGETESPKHRREESGCLPLVSRHIQLFESWLSHVARSGSRA